MNKRQKIIFNKLKESEIGIKDLLIFVNQKNERKVSKITVIRDLDRLIKLKLVVRKGRGPAVKCHISACYKMFEDVDMKNYFLDDPSERDAKTKFDLNIFNLTSESSVFNQRELNYLDELNNSYQKNINNLPQDIIKREFERLMIELSWKSSRIEGNTYDLLETEFLIKENREAEGHTKLEARMILNHKDALEFIKKEDYKEITPNKIKKVHLALTKEMRISNEFRNKPVGITGTRYRPLDDSDAIKNSLKRLCDLVNQKSSLIEKSILLNLIIAYIQPFNDGNKRTSRMMGNAILLSYGFCPLSFRSVDELEYKKAVILFYEQNNLNNFKRLFIDQYKFAVDNYFRASSS